MIYFLFPLWFNSILGQYFEFLKFICWFALYFLFNFISFDLQLNIITAIFSFGNENEVFMSSVYYELLKLS